MDEDLKNEYNPQHTLSSFERLGLRLENLGQLAMDTEIRRERREFRTHAI